MTHQGITMPDNSTECILGRLQADTENMKELLQKIDERSEHDLREMRNTLKQVDERLRAVEDIVLTARVGWKTVLFVGSTLTTLGGFIWAALHYFSDPALKLAKSILGA